MGSTLAGASSGRLFSQAAPSAPDEGVEKVLVMFKCHLDVGFVDTQAAILDRYFKQFYPRAISIAEKMRQSGEKGNAPFVWTTGSWLLYGYLEQANAQERKRMEQAIAQGDIAWHALPFTWQTELLDRSAILGCLGFSKTLDRRFGRTTTGAKMTDVPGHSRGLIAPLAEGGVSVLDIGVNAASTPPDVPPVFVWKDQEGASIIVIYHRTDYGGVVRIPQSKVAIAVEVRDDNSGPHTPEEIRKIHAELRQQFPKATIAAADLTTIANAVKPFEHALPTVTQEVGDTWIYGVPSDPWKVARFRELLRLRQGWVRNGKFKIADETDLALLQHAALGAEHTWGTDTKTWLDFEHYTPAALHQMLGKKNYQTVTASWQEKRADIEAGVAALPEGLRREAQEQFAQLKPMRPEINRLSPHEAGSLFESDYFAIGLDARTGAIVRLEDKKNGRQWAAQQNPLAAFTYQTLSQNDYDNFLASYITKKTEWAPKDFGKPNIQKFGAESQSLGSRLIKAYRAEDDYGQRLIAHLRVEGPEEQQVTAYPKELWLTIVLPKGEPVVDLHLGWFDKVSNRLPEALWLSFFPVAPEAKGWTLTKVGQAVSPFDVVPGGNRHMHAISDAITYRDDNGSLKIETLDAPVVALGERSPIYFSKDQPDISKGLHFSLFNNGWGTNYVQWFGEDMQFRFRIRTEG